MKKRNWLMEERTLLTYEGGCFRLVQLDLERGATSIGFTDEQVYHLLCAAYIELDMKDTGLLEQLNKLSDRELDDIVNMEYDSNVSGIYYLGNRVSLQHDKDTYTIIDSIENKIILSREDLKNIQTIIRSLSEFTGSELLSILEICDDSLTLKIKDMAKSILDSRENCINDSNLENLMRVIGKIRDTSKEEEDRLEEECKHTYYVSFVTSCSEGILSTVIKSNKIDSLEYIREIEDILSQKCGDTASLISFSEM